ncbi:MAG: efflux RND transporter periplasmic adaptor subunit [Pseudomonadota bacterium]
MHTKRFGFPLVSALALLLTACSGGDGGPPDGAVPPAQVNAAQVVSRSIVDWDEFTGRIEAIDDIEIRPRVSGYLSAVHFEEGAAVSKGDLLFTIDPREYQAEVNSAHAQLARVDTRIGLARSAVARVEKLVAARAASTEELEQAEADLEQALADRQAAQADLERMELDLEFASIHSPIDGRIGAALIKPGNLVQADLSLLTTVVSVDPVYVSFRGDEQIYLKYLGLDRAGERQSSRDAPNPVLVGLAIDNDFPYRGEMVFVDNEVDPDTGTIQGKAVLANPDGLFTPGLFARVRLLGSGEYNALLIHDRAVLTDQDRKYVYVVGENSEAVRKDVVLGRSYEGLRVVLEGLTEADLVVVNGVRKIFFPGAPLAPEVVPMDQPQGTLVAPAAAAGGEDGA